MPLLFFEQFVTLGSSRAVLLSQVESLRVLDRWETNIAMRHELSETQATRQFWTAWT